MASFLARTAGLGGNAPVVNAQTAVTAGSATTAQTATNAQQLGGQPASAYLRADAPPNTTGYGRVASGGIAQDTPNEYDANYKPVARVSITVPTSGYVLVSGTVTLYATAASVALIAVAPDGTTPSDSNAAWVNFGNGVGAVSGTTSGVFSVAAGQHLFTIYARRWSGGPIGPFPGNKVTALFVPLDGSTATAQP